MARHNLIENAICPSAIGKKNCLRLRSQASLKHAAVAAGRWLFMGDPTSGDRAATFYTLICNGHRQGINAEAYLTDIFQRLPTETNQTVHRLTPKAWATEQATLRQALGIRQI